MTQNSTIQGPKVALFEPDIPQNTAAIIRTCACLGAKLEIIEPCGFLLSDKRFKRVVMDYMNEKDINYYQSFNTFLDAKKDQRIVLMTTKASVSYTNFKFDINVWFIHFHILYPPHSIRERVEFSMFFSVDHISKYLLKSYLSSSRSWLKQF